MRILLSWSGGKDGALALARLRDEGHEVVLAHVTDAATRRDRAHGVPDFIVQEQAIALGARLWLGASDVAGYGDAMASAVREAAPDALAFGDINFVAHREWGERLAAKAGVDALWPLWNEPTREVADDVIARGFRAFIVAARGPLDESFLGRFLDPDLVEDVAARGADAAGEGGEYHTLVVDGPLFQRRLEVTAGEAHAVDGGWRLDLGLRGC